MLCQHGRLECWECARAAIGNVHDTLITGDPMYKHGFSDGSSSVAELETQLAERDKIIALTREALAAMVSYAREEGKCLKIADDALDATKDLSGLTLCDAEPIGYFAYSEMETGGVWEELFGPEYPGATALYAKRTEKKKMMTRAQLRHQAAIDRYQANKQKPPTRKWLRSWLYPIRKTMNELRTGYIDTYRGYPITKLDSSDEDFARIDYAINGYVALIDRLMPDFDTSPIKTVGKKLENGTMLEQAEVSAAIAMLNDVEDRLIRFKRCELADAANVEMTVIELERLGIKEAA